MSEASIQMWRADAMGRRDALVAKPTIPWRSSGLRLRLALMRHAGRYQRGQSMTEFIVVAFAMMPLFLLMPMIAKYQDIAHETQMAARYVAFDGTIRNDASVGGWKSQSELAIEVRRRFFGTSDAPIKTKDAAGEFDAHRNLFWRTPNNKPLVGKFSDVTVSFGQTHSSSNAAGFEVASDGIPFVGTAESMALKAPGIYTANVHVKLAKLPAGLRFYEPFDKLELAMTRSSSILLNPWAARDTSEVAARIEAAPAVFPAAALAKPGETFSWVVSMAELGTTSGPKLGKLDFWKDVVPEDRLRSKD